MFRAGPAPSGAVASDVGKPELLLGFPPLPLDLELKRVEGPARLFLAEVQALSPQTTETEARGLRHVGGLVGDALSRGPRPRGGPASPAHRVVGDRSGAVAPLSHQVPRIPCLPPQGRSAHRTEVDPRAMSATAAPLQAGRSSRVPSNEASAASVGGKSRWRNRRAAFGHVQFEPSEPGPPRRTLVPSTRDGDFPRFVSPAA
jgi:hypothetical protein